MVIQIEDTVQVGKTKNLKKNKCEVFVSRTIKKQYCSQTCE